jgi:hypothetical protein
MVYSGWGSNRARQRKADARSEGAVSGRHTGRHEAGKDSRRDISFEKGLWDAAVRLRGNIAPADYKHYVLPLLFLRYLSNMSEGERN